MIYSLTKVISKLISVMYIFHVYNGMMGVILLTVELISLGSTASTYPPPGHLTMIRQGLTKQDKRESPQANTHTYIHT